MPVLNTQLRGEIQNPDGVSTPIPSNIVLLQRGPVVQVAVSIEEHIAQQLQQSGQTLPQPISGIALIDTGATATCIDEDAAQSLGLPVVDVVTIASSTHPAQQRNVYPIHIEFMGIAIRVNAPRAIGVPLQAQGLLALLGRDVLRYCTLFYNGLTGTFSLSI